MKRVLGNIKIISIFTTVVICIILCNKVATHLFSIEGFSCCFDKKISNYYQNEIFDFINMHEQFKNSSLEYIGKKIQDQFELVSSLELFQVASGVLQVRIKAIDPKFIANDDMVISENGILFEKMLFSKESLSDCHNLYIGNLDFVKTSMMGKNRSIPEAYKNIIFNIPLKCFQDYEVVLEHKTKHYMRDKLQKDFYIYFSDTVFPNEKIMSACEQLKLELQNGGAFGNKKNIRWIADVRFKDQIVLSKSRGGGDG